MADYQIIPTAFPLVVRASDGMVITNVVTHPDRIAYNEWLMAGNVPDSLPVTTPPVISKAQFYSALATMGTITQQNAVQAMNGNLPDVIDLLIENLPQKRRFHARMFFRADRISRIDPLIDELQTATGHMMDEIFRVAERL